MLLTFFLFFFQFRLVQVNRNPTQTSLSIKGDLLDYITGKSRNWSSFRFDWTEELKGGCRLQSLLICLYCLHFFLLWTGVLHVHLHEKSMATGSPHSHSTSKKKDLFSSSSKLISEKGSNWPRLGHIPFPGLITVPKRMRWGHWLGLRA